MTGIGKLTTQARQIRKVSPILEWWNGLFLKIIERVKKPSCRCNYNNYIQMNFMPLS